MAKLTHRYCMKKWNERLAKACETDDSLAANLALEAGAGLEAGKPYQDGLTWPPLVNACWNGSFGVAKVLVEKGANVNSRCTRTQSSTEEIADDGLTPLLAAIQSPADPRKEDLVKLLLRRGADPDLGTQRGNLPILACTPESKWAIPLLLDAGSKAHLSAGSGALHNVAGCGDLQSVKRIIAEGASPDAKDSRDGTPLLNAAASLRYDIVEYLLNAGAIVDFTPENGKSALHRACDRATRVNGQENIDAAVNTIRVLLKYKAKVDSKDCFKKTPIMYLKESPCEEAMRVFRESGYNENDPIHRVKPQYLKHEKP